MKSICNLASVQVNGCKSFVFRHRQVRPPPGEENALKIAGPLSVLLNTDPVYEGVDSLEAPPAV